MYGLIGSVISIDIEPHDHAFTFYFMIVMCMCKGVLVASSKIFLCKRCNFLLVAIQCLIENVAYNYGWNVFMFAMALDGLKHFKFKFVQKKFRKVLQFLFINIVISYGLYIYSYSYVMVNVQDTLWNWIFSSFIWLNCFCHYGKNRV